MSNSNNIFTKFKNMPVDGIVKTVIVATALCFVCSCANTLKPFTIGGSCKLLLSAPELSG